MHVSQIRSTVEDRLDQRLFFDVHVDRIDEMQALFGQEQYIFSSNRLESEPRMERAKNGVWVGPTGVQYRRISAVLIAPDVLPWTVAVRNVRLYHNPWANDQANSTKYSSALAGSNSDLPFLSFSRILIDALFYFRKIFVSY